MRLSLFFNLDAAHLEHLVVPVVKVPFCACGTEGRQTFVKAIQSIGTVIFGWAKAKPRLIGGESHSVFALSQQLRVVLHHALQARRGLEHGPVGVGVFRIDKLWDDATRALKVFNVGRQPEHQRIGVAREVRETLFVRDVALRVPLFLEQRLQLVVLHVDNLRRCLAPRFRLQAGNGAHGLSRAPRHANCIHFPVPFS